MGIQLYNDFWQAKHFFERALFFIYKIRLTGTSAKLFLVSFESPTRNMKNFIV